MNRTSVITDWRTRDEDLPDVPPGEDHERVITPQRHVLLRRILVVGMRLVQLRIGATEVPFRLEGCDGRRCGYRPLPDGEALSRLRASGARSTSEDVVVPAGMDVRLLLRNDGDAPARPVAALLVLEEAP